MRIISLLLICLLFLPMLGCDSPLYSETEVIAMAKEQLRDTNTAFWQAEYQGDNKWLVSYQVERGNIDSKELYDEHINLITTRYQTLYGRAMNEEELDALEDYIFKVYMHCSLVISPNECQEVLRNIPQGQEADVMKRLILDETRNWADPIPAEIVNIIANWLIEDYYPARIYYIFYERIFVWEFSHSEPLNLE